MLTSQLLNVLHQGPAFCSNFLPPSEHLQLYSALLCGVALNSGAERQLFLDSGLIHIMVVSGAHLMFLENLTGFLPLRWRLTILGSYCWLTGFGAPIVKAFARRILEGPLHRLGWSPLQIEGATVVLLLAIVPWWLYSRSFLMSWLSALTFLIPRILPSSSWDQSLKAYLLLYFFCPSSPITIFWNALLAPVVGVLLFPACVLVLPLRFLSPLTDRLWDVFLMLLEFGPKAPPEPWFWQASALIWWPILLHAVLIWGDSRWRRRLAFS